MSIKTQSFNLAGCPVYTEQLPDFSPEVIINSGQAFRFYEDSPGYYEIIAGDRRLFFREGEHDLFTFYCSRQEFQDFWHQYFDLDTDYSKFREMIPEKDWFLTAAAEFSSGLRILRQDTWEMLVTFLLAQRKSLTSISHSIDKLCALAGTEITDCAGSFYAFPTPEQLASLSEEQLASCGLGYRTAYVKAAAEAAAAGEIDFDRLRNVDNRTASEMLRSLNGVGSKIADCVLLFGLHRFDSFPVDVWIERIEKDLYGGHFPKEQYEGSAGVIQQYLFNYGRNEYYRKGKLEAE